MIEKPTMPVFVFGRRRDIERETGLILAGQLIVDIPKNTKPRRRHQRMIADIVQMLIARAGEMPEDAMVVGWPGEHRPANAVDVNDDALMASWAKDRTVIVLRIDPRNDGYLRIDSDMLLQAGLLKRQ
jgi:hypothetical protein